MVYTLDIFSAREHDWTNWEESPNLDRIREVRKKLLERGFTCRVREIRDLTSGNRWID